MVIGTDDKELVFHQLFIGEVFLFGIGCSECKVDLAITNEIKRCSRQGIKQGKAHPGVNPREFGKDLWQQRGGQRGKCSNRHRTSSELYGVRHGAQGTLRIAQDLLGMGDKDMARIGQLDGASSALKQSCSDLGFYTRNQGRQRRLREVNLERGLAKALGLAQSDHRPQVFG